jgi:hypothetical protein
VGDGGEVVIAGAEQLAGVADLLLVHPRARSDAKFGGEYAGQVLATDREFGCEIGHRETAWDMRGHRIASGLQQAFSACFKARAREVAEQTRHQHGALSSAHAGHHWPALQTCQQLDGGVLVAKRAHRPVALDQFVHRGRRTEKRDKHEAPRHTVTRVTIDHLWVGNAAQEGLTSLNPPFTPATPKQATA